MQQAQERNLVTALKNLLLYCQELQVLFKHDKQAFIKNQHDALPESNQKKNIFLQKITDVIHEVQLMLGDDKSTSLFASIKKASAQVSQAVKNELMALEAELNKEIPNCYQQIIINNNLASDSVIRLKTLSSKLLSCREDIGCMYDSKGNRVK